MHQYKNQRILLCAVVIICCALNSVHSQAPNTNANNNNSDDAADARTFGHHLMKRLSFAVIPGAFVVGVITTLLAALTVVSMKGLGVGVVLLVLAIGQMLSRTLPHVHAAAAYTAPVPPVPIVYSHAHTQQPVWLEKDW